MALSPIVTANSSSTASGYNTTAGASITLALVSDVTPQGWEILCLATDGSNTIDSINASLTYNWSNYTVTFTMPNNVCSLQFVSRVNYGRIDQRTYQFGIYVLNAAGLRLQFGVPTTIDFNALSNSYSSFNVNTPSIIYGSLTESAGSIDLTVANTYYTVPLTTQGPSSNIIYATNEIKVHKTGTVLISGNLSLAGNISSGKPASGDQISLQIYQTGTPATAIGVPNVVQAFSNNGSVALSVQALITVSVVDSTYYLAVADLTNAATGLTVTAANLTIISI